MKLLIKNTFIRIKNTIGRFLSLFFIVALGLGFFSGVRSTSKYMLTTADNYYDKTNLYDYKIVSTYGLNDDDLKSIKELKDVKEAVATYSKDVLVKGKVYRIHALEDINLVSLKKGKMPQKQNECLAELGMHKIGDKIKLDEETQDLNEQEFTVVGLVESPLYTSIEKPITMIGNGKLNSYIYVIKDTFNMPYYTEIYLLNKYTKDKESYSEEYDLAKKPLQEKLENLKPIRETTRYEEILKKITEEIAEKEDQLKQEEEKNRNKLKKAEKQLINAENKILNGKKELENAKNLLKQKKDETTKLFEKNSKDLENSNKKLLEAKKYYEENHDKIKQEIDKGKEELKLFKTNLDKQKQAIELLKENDPTNEKLPKLEEDYEANLIKYKKLSDNLNEKEKEFNETPKKLEETEKSINEGRNNLIHSQNAFNKEIEKQTNLLNQNENKINASIKTLNEQKNSLNKGKQEFNDKINEAKSLIQEKKDELKNLPKPVWYLQQRKDQTGYTDFKNDALRVDNIAKVFPIFFLLVAALVCLNTMTRMVEEDRTEIGIYKALGYSNNQIIFNYFLYVGLATILGGIVGLLVGYNVFPRVIYSIYNFTYNLPSIIIKINPLAFILILIISLVLTLSVTWFSCNKVLKEDPASLLRPKAPKNGKQVFLEKIPFIWDKLNFSSKVTVRNLLRYKKRIFMTIIGIAGCTSLTLTGFGLKDGISSIIKKQYNDLFTYDVLAVLKDGKEEIKEKEEINKLLQENNIEKPLYISQELYNFSENNKQNDFFLIVPEETERIDEYIKLQDRKSKKKKKLNDDGAIITEKMANLLNVKIGDHITIRNSNNEAFVIKVSDIVENYTYHYVYLTKEYFNKAMGKDPKYNMLYANLTDENKNTEEIATNLIATEKFLNINFTKDSIKSFDTILDSLNKIVLLILVSSCLLALVVLYNLTNINIIERKRELATLKVLGFYDKEVSDYIYRETAILTIFGIAVGLIAGIFLHRYVMNTAEMDFIMFLKEIKPMSFVYSALITIIFSIIVEIFTHFKLKKIDMIESLKSVE